MNVLICVNTLNYGMGGVSTHIMDLCKGYSTSNVIEQVILCCDGGEHIDTIKSVEKLEYIQIPFHDYGLSFMGILYGYSKLKKIVKKYGIDIVHVHSQRIIPQAYLLKLLDKVPFIWTNHIDAIPNEKMMKFMCRTMKFPIISVSQQLKNMMVEKYKCNSNKVYVVNNGIDLSRFAPLTDREKAETEKRYSINREQTPYVISLLSRINEGKGQDRLLKAISLSSYKSKIKVIIAGHTYSTTEKYKQQLEEYARLNQIDTCFLDFSNPREVFGVSDLFVLPSRYEGFALVCIEALAMGCAVIRTRTPGYQEMQKWTEIVEIDDVLDLSRKIDEAIENDFNKEKTKLGRDSVFTLFTKEKCAENTLNVYKKVIKCK